MVEVVEVVMVVEVVEVVEQIEQELCLCVEIVCVNIMKGGTY